MPYYGLTEAQVIELIQRHTAQTGRVKSTEYALPSEILEGLEDSSSKELRTNTQKFTKKPCNTTEASGPSQAQSIRYGDRLRVAARGVTEVFEEIKFVVERGGGDNDSELLEQVLEKVRRLTIYAFAAGKSIDNEAKGLTARSLKLPGSKMLTEFSKPDMKKPLSTRYGNQQFRHKGQGQYRKSNIATRLQDSVVVQADPMGSKKLSSFRNGEETCSRSGTQVFRIRGDREISFPRRSVPIQLIYDPGERQDKTYLVLQTNQCIHSVSAL
ncbi:hypothetical protein G6F70_001969 [Rhizopus microsporus]|nr:hypothetical protein G6F71_002115 [Rhizopus microsporus]KAG1202769.1 hypothetical protein G6F70_001969 [Rhizopus microsporus]